jgi:hypothetical protein
VADIPLTLPSSHWGRGYGEGACTWNHSLAYAKLNSWTFTVGDLHPCSSCQFVPAHPHKWVSAPISGGQPPPPLPEVGGLYCLSPSLPSCLPTCALLPSSTSFIKSIIWPALWKARGGGQLFGTAVALSHGHGRVAQDELAHGGSQLTLPSTAASREACCCPQCTT